MPDPRPETKAVPVEVLRDLTDGYAPGLLKWVELFGGPESEHAIKGLARYCLALLERERELVKTAQRVLYDIDDESEHWHVAHSAAALRRALTAPAAEGGK